MLRERMAIVEELGRMTFSGAMVVLLELVVVCASINLEFTFVGERREGERSKPGIDSAFDNASALRVCTNRQF